MTLAERIRRFVPSPYLRFGLVGGCGFVVDETILTILHYGIGIDRYSARAVSIFCAATFTWWGNRNLTFAEHATTGGLGALAHEWFKFMLANGIGALVNYSVYSFLVTFAPFPLDSPLVATAAGVAVGLVFNFTLSKRFVFRAS